MDRFIYKERRSITRNDNVEVFAGLFNNIITKILLLTISVFLLYNVAHSVNITVQKLDILRRAKVEVDTLRLKNLELAMLLGNMQSREYLEVQARDRLNFAGEKEYVFVIPENVLEEAGEDMDNLLGINEVEEIKPVYEIWEDFILNGI
jgi:cell division protein FtsB